MAPPNSDGFAISRGLSRRNDRRRASLWMSWETRQRTFFGNAGVIRRSGRGLERDGSGTGLRAMLKITLRRD